MNCLALGSRHGERLKFSDRVDQERVTRIA